MEERDSKLTVLTRSRYDRERRSMSESTATDELRKGVKREIYEAWAPQFEATDDPNKKDTIWRLIQQGIRPEDAPKSVDQMSQEEVDKKFQEIKKQAENPRTPQELEEMADKYISNVKELNTGPSNAPGVVIRNEENWRYEEDEDDSVSNRINRIKENWAKYNGWTTEKIKQVGHALHTELDLGYSQIHNAIELLVATGQTPDQVLPNLAPGQYETYVRSDEAKSIAQNDRIPPRLSYFSQKLNISDDHARKFIVYNEFKAENESEYQNTDPDTVEAMAWQIQHHYGIDKWGPSGEFPVLEMRIAKDKDGNVKGKYYINQANMTRWLRDRMWYAYDLSPDDPQNFFKTGLEKSYRPLDLTTIYLTPGRYFKSEDGKTDYYGDLGVQWVTEAWALGTLRSWDVSYKKAMHDPGELMKTIQSIFSDNTFTKSSFRKNLFSLMAKMPLNYKGAEKENLPRSDSILGAAWNDMFLAYYSLSDFDELQKILGKGSSFFTKEGFLAGFKKVLKDKTTDASGETRPRGLGGPELHEHFEKAFDQHGQVSSVLNQEHFTALLSNFLAVKMNNTNIEETLRVMLRNAIAEKYGRKIKTKGERKGEIVEKYALVTDEGKEDDTSLRMAEIFAFSMIRIFGAGARNDPTASGYDFFNKMHYVQTYRQKNVDKNGDAMGSLFTVPLIKTIAVDAPNAITTNAQKVRLDSFGRPMVKKDKKTGEVKEVLQNKSFMEVMKEMSQLMSAHASKQRQLEQEIEVASKSGNKEVKDRKEKELAQYKKEMNDVIQNKAGEFEFKQAALSNYYDDHVMRAKETYDLIMKAGEVEMEKYAKFDAWGGVHFDREEFQKDVQDKMIHPIRYFLNTYPDLNYNMVIRALDQTATIANHGIPIFRDMTLGESMFGHELLNREKFWLKDPKTHKPICKRDMKGRPVKGVYEIDYNKVNDNKTFLWKQFFMTKLAADLYAHRDMRSTDTRFDINYFKDIIKAIESIPADLKVDEYKMIQHTKGRFFDKADMRWFKKTIKVENYDLYVRAVFKDLFLPEDQEQGIGLLAALGLFTRSIIKQGS